MKKGSRLEPSPTNDPLMACLKGFEPLTHGLEGRCSIQLSYRHKMERVKGIEPSRPAWKAGILPLNYTRINMCAKRLFYYTNGSWFCQYDFLRVFRAVNTGFCLFYQLFLANGSPILYRLTRNYSTQLLYNLQVLNRYFHKKHFKTV